MRRPATCAFPQATCAATSRQRVSFSTEDDRQRRGPQAAAVDRERDAFPCAVAGPEHVALSRWARTSLLERDIAEGSGEPFRAGRGVRTRLLRDLSSGPGG